MGGYRKPAKLKGDGGKQWVETGSRQNGKRAETKAGGNGKWTEITYLGCYNLTKAWTSSSVVGR